MTIGSLFSGIGGLELGLERAGLGPVIWQAECEPFAREVLRRHWPGVRCFRDVREVRHGRADRPRVLCGGFPCQPVSVAGKGLGQDDPRWLWPECRRIAGELEPEWCVWENVPPLRTRGLCGVLLDVAGLGLNAEWFDLRASDVGAPHRRARIFIVTHRDGDMLDRFRAHLDRAMAERGRGPNVADASGRRVQRRRGARDVAGETGAPRDERGGSDASELASGAGRETLAHGHGRGDVGEARVHDHGAPGNDVERGSLAAFPPRPFDRAGWDRWIARGGPEPVVRGDADGIPDRLDRLSALGNAVLPAVGEVIGRAIVAAERGAL